LFILGFAPYLFAQEPSLDSTVESRNLSGQKEKNLSKLQKEARDYRAQGLEYQRIGNLEAAMSLYQKAIQLDPSYSVAYNDLGIMYEANGLIDRAEEAYLKSIKIDPNYLSAYTNLALLYENKRDLNKAAFYWQKRAELGSPDDSWVQKAKQRLEDIRLVLSSKPFEDSREKEVVGLLKDVTVKKSILKKDKKDKKDNKQLAKDCFEKAKLRLKKGDEVTALKLAIDAGQLDPTNREIEEFTDKIQERLLSR